MDPLSLYELSLVAQVSLGSGFLAYVIAYAGFRRDHAPVDAVFITLAFSAIASLVFSSSIELGEWVASMLAGVATIFAACIWRKWLNKLCLKLLADTGVHREDGVHRAWAAIVQADRKVGQVAVHTKDGRVLHLLDRRKFAQAPWEGVYFGGDGSLIMIVEEEDLDDGRTLQRETISDQLWGDRMSFIPADEIKRVEVRMK